MEQLALATNEINVADTNQIEQNEVTSFEDIFSKYTFNATQKRVVELKCFEGLDYNDIAVKVKRHPNHINRVLHEDKVMECIAEIKNVMWNEGIKELTEIAYNEAVRLLKDKDTPVKQRVDLIKHILPEGKKNIDLNLGQQEKQNW